MFQIDYSNPLHVHFMGIGGISMSGLAEVLFDRGFTISGSDNTPSEITDRLETMGMHISHPQKRKISQTTST